MPNSPPKRILEKSRTVRRRHQRSNKRFQFTASQIARIEREEEREKKAHRLRDKEKKRIANKKKKAEKEAKAREERRRLGLPDPNAPTIPSSQPLLFNFLKKGPPSAVAPAPAPVPVQQETTTSGATSTGDDDDDGDTEPESPGSAGSVISSSEFSDIEEEAEELARGMSLGAESAGAGNDNGKGSTEEDDQADKDRAGEREDDEFSDCSSIFQDENILNGTETTTTGLPTASEALPGPGPVQQTDTEPAAKSVAGSSFCDDTALFLEEYSREYATDEEFEQELLQLAPTP